MTRAAVLALTLSGQGFWFGGHTGKIELRWACDAEMPATMLAWRLMLGEAEVARGRTAFLARADAPQLLQIELPRLRVRTELTWRWSLTRADDGAAVAKGEAAIHAFPHGLLGAWADRLRSSPARIIAWDVPPGMPRLLAAHGIPHVAIADAGQLAGLTADVVLVAAGRLDGDTYAQAALLRVVRAGAGAIVFEQSGVRLAGHAVRRRPTPDRLACRFDHPLLRGLDEGAFAAWLPGSRDTWAIRFTNGKQGRAIVFWPSAAPEGPPPAVVDALLTTEAVGAGRLILCQLPISHWDEDPRAQLLLDNALDYLLSGAADVDATPAGEGAKRPIFQ